MRTGGLILTGGASSRMGEDKAARLWVGRRAVDRVADLARAAGCHAVVTAGATDYGLPYVADPAPLSGPVAGVIGAMRRFAGRAERWLVLAVDAPTLRLEDLAPLLASPSPGACFEGLPLPMIIAADAAPSEAADGWPLRRFVDRAGLARFTPDPEAAARARGANTPAEQAHLESLEGWGPAPLGSPEAP